MAADLNTGAIRWQHTLGNVPELAGKGLPETGAPNIGGSIVTAGGLVFIASTTDRRFRAFDARTGQELWSAKLPASGHALPMTCLDPKTGRQIVLIAAGGGGFFDGPVSDELIAFSLKNDKLACGTRLSTLDHEMPLFAEPETTSALTGRLCGRKPALRHADVQQQVVNATVVRRVRSELVERAPFVDIP